jgi:hypothetical protein
MDRPPPSAGGRRERVVRSLIVAAVAAALTLAFTAPYGILNQATYLLDPLHRAFPELFHRDWLITEAPPYLPSFGWLVRWLYALDPEGPVAMLAANFAVTFATYLALDWLVAAVCPGRRGFVLVASFVTVTMGRALGGSYLLAGYLQPSAPATLGWIVAMAALVRGRYWTCGVALAVAGAMHVNFLVLGVGLFTLAALARRDVRREVRLVDLAGLLVPQLAVLAALLPGLIASAGPGHDALRILVHFHAPGHYLGRRLISWVPGLVGWQLAGFAALPPAGARSRELVALWRFSLVSCAIAVAAAFVVHVPAFEWLTQAFWPRIAPFGQLACQVLIAAALVRQGSAPAPSVARRAWMAVAIALALALNGKFLHTPLPVTALAIAATVAVLAVPVRFAGRAYEALAALALAAALWASPRGSGLTTVPAADPQELALYRWVREATPIDALFVAPPSLSLFRLLGRRAIVADTKSPPLQPALMVRWYRRLCELVDRTDVETHEEVERLWDRLTPDQLERVARGFGADFIVVWAAARLPGAPVYANARFAVYPVAPR